VQGDDKELMDAIDAEVEQQVTTSPRVALEFRHTFGTADTSLAQQWISYGLGQHTDEVNAMALSAQDTATVYDGQGTEQDEEGEDDDAPVDSGNTVGDLTAGTRVVLVNHRDSFYGAVGTVAGPAAAGGHVAVTFDLKPGGRYNVPAAHLDVYTDPAQTARLLKGNGGRWTITGVPSLVQFLRAKEGDNGRWAFTGSVALSCWAREYNVPFRHPHDMDIVVANLNGWYYDLGQAVNGTPGMPSIKANHRTLRLDLGKLDIIAAGQGLGEFGAGPYTVGGVPVVGLRTIGHYKEMRNTPKDVEDLKFVDQLLRLQEK
jgi:hypothetical protein